MKHSPGRVRCPNAGLYRLAACCLGFGVAEGWLVNAAVDGPCGPLQLVAGPAVVGSAVQLDLPFSDAQHQTSQIATRAASSIAARPSLDSVKRAHEKANRIADLVARCCRANTLAMTGAAGLLGIHKVQLAVAAGLTVMANAAQADEGKIVAS